MSNKMIYKYLSYEDAIRTIESNSVVLNNPLNYNDPFDSLIDFDEKDTSKVINLLIEVAFVKEMIKFLNNENLQVKWYLKPIIWFEKAMINLNMKITKKRRYYVSNPMLSFMVNFILKIIANKTNEVSNAIEESKRNLLNEWLPKLKEMRSKALISCFSMKNDSILMWGHYADKHNGICIGYERPKQNFYDVEYTAKRVKFPLYDLACIVVSYLIFDETPSLDNKIIIQKSLKNLLTKSKDWEYEKEVRCLFSLIDNQNFENIGFGKYLYKMPCDIATLYLGCKITNEQKEKVLRLIKNKEIKVYQFVESKDKYELISMEI